MKIKAGCYTGQERLTTVEKNHILGLIPASALSLQELKRKHDNSPVFVKCIAPKLYCSEPIQGWGLIRTSIVRLWHKSDLAVFDYHFEDYGVTWVAFEACVDETLIRDWTK